MSTSDKKKKPASVTIRPPEKPSLLDPEAFWEGATEQEEPEKNTENTIKVSTTQSAVGIRQRTAQSPVVPQPPLSPKECLEPEQVFPSPQVSKRPTIQAPPKSTPRVLIRTTKRNWSLPLWVLAGLVLLAVVGWFARNWLADREEKSETAKTKLKKPGLAELDWRTREAMVGATQTKTQLPQTQTSKESDFSKPLCDKLITLKLTSDPAQAVVFVNGQKRGATPTHLKDIVPGKKLALRIETEGYRPWIQTVAFDCRELVREIHAGLTKEEICEAGTGWVYISTVPPGATVEMDGKRLPGKTPMVINQVCSGMDHKIRIQAVGTRTWWKSINVSEGEVLNLDIELPK